MFIYICDIVIISLFVTYKLNPKPKTNIRLSFIQIKNDKNNVGRSLSKFLKNVCQIKSPKKERQIYLKIP